MIVDLGALIQGGGGTGRAIGLATFKCVKVAQKAGSRLPWLHLHFPPPVGRAPAQTPQVGLPLSNKNSNKADCGVSS